MHLGEPSPGFVLFSKNTISNLGEHVGEQSKKVSKHVKLLTYNDFLDSKPCGSSTTSMCKGTQVTL